MILGSIEFLVLSNDLKIRKQKNQKCVRQQYRYKLTPIQNDWGRCRRIYIRVK